MFDLIEEIDDCQDIVFHCALSQQRGPSSALKFLRSLQEDDHFNVYVLRGGFYEWQKIYGRDKNVTLEYDRNFWRYYWQMLSIVRTIIYVPSLSLCADCRADSIHKPCCFNKCVLDQSNLHHSWSNRPYLTLEHFLKLLCFPFISIAVLIRFVAVLCLGLPLSSNFFPFLSLFLSLFFYYNCCYYDLICLSWPWWAQ